MLNKKTIFNVVYAIAIVGLISTCFGLLTELTNFAELRKGNLYADGVHNFYNNQEKKIITYYTIAFLFCFCSTAAFILNLFFKNKKFAFIGVIISTVLSAATCVTVLLFASSLLKFFASASINISGSFGRELESAGYLVCTTFRTAAFTFVCYTAILIACNGIHCICKAKNTPKQDDEVAE